ncbi:MAG: type VI secretion system baseplate subunit TssF [Succinivibrionaceae bacterium]|nr:type VI secretion system baseplate subunit TssF [Succinivibrionaceae bacterium]
MINKYYQQQISLLRDLGSEFSKKYPALAPMLAGQNADPDVERILEGSAFLTGLVQERLDDDFPELVHGITQLMFPYYLFPIPSSTIIQFRPSGDLKNYQTISKGTELLSREIDGECCRYTTTDETVVYPLTVAVAEDGQNLLKLDFSFSSGSLKEFNVKKLRLFVSGNYGSAADFIFDLAQTLESVTFSCGYRTVELPAAKAIEVLVPTNLTVVPYEYDMMGAFRDLQSYFQLPEIFCFFNLNNLDMLDSMDSNFSVTFNFKVRKTAGFTKNSQIGIRLFCIPAVNVFKHEAETVVVDYKNSEYRVMPYRNNALKVYSIDRVVGFLQGSVEEREYKPFVHFNPQSEQIPLYNVNRRKAKLTSGSDVYISVSTPNNSANFVPETLVISISCTNGSATEKLRLGDICVISDKIPLFVEYSNITHPTAPIDCPLGENLLWRLLSHIYLNQKSITNTNALASLLKLYVFTDTSNKMQVQLNTKKIESIKSVVMNDTIRLIHENLVRGSQIDISFLSEGFASSGDMYIFANVIQSVLGAYTAINSYTVVNFTDLSNGEIFKCKELQFGSRVNL